MIDLTHPTAGVKHDSTLDSALYLASQGFRVFPVCGIDQQGNGICLRTVCSDSTGKHPILSGWRSLATTDPEQINEWWHEWPDANVGIATGNGLFVLDVDSPKSGEDGLEDLQEKYDPLPDTLMVQTGGGGWHYYFRSPKDVRVKNSVRDLGPGLDIRGDGGFVVGPGSLHRAGRRYEFEASTDLDNLAIAEAPPWLIELVTGIFRTEGSSGKGPLARKPTPHWPSKVPRGGRNTFLHAKASHLRDRYFSQESTLVHISALNNLLSVPPLAEKEVRKIVDSVYKAKRRPSRKPGPSEGAMRVHRWLRERCHGPNGPQPRQFTIRQIAEGVGLSNRGVQKCVKSLERWDFLLVERINGMPSHYYPVPPLGGEQGVNGVHSSLSSYSESSHQQAHTDIAGDHAEKIFPESTKSR